LFSGLSAGSILIVMALGLSITFGLMGVINMAHGEMLMVGAYATLLVQWGFCSLFTTSLMPYYFPLGVVAGFLCRRRCRLADRVTDRPPSVRSSIGNAARHLGVSCLLIQTMRVIFGDNRASLLPIGWSAAGNQPVD